AEEGYARLQKSDGAPPDLIFLDINLPVMNGWQFLTKLKTQKGLDHIPVIMYSTSSNARDKKTAFELGALCFITKPDAFRSLQGMLGVVVEYANKNAYDLLCDAVHKSVKN
ncbi:MAG: response regulator, partial [Bacteroidetes bacterium]|nr:response regulator [Bacteroidota bacterium]